VDGAAVMMLVGSIVYTAVLSCLSSYHSIWRHNHSIQVGQIQRIVRLGVYLTCTRKVTVVGWSDVAVICDLSVVGQDGVLCEVRW